MTDESDGFTDEDNAKRNEIISDYTRGLWFIDFGRTGSWGQHLTRLSASRFVLTMRHEDPTDKEQEIRWFRTMLDDMTEEQAIAYAQGLYQHTLDLREKQFGDRAGLEVLRGELTLKEFEARISQRPHRYFIINPQFGCARSYASDGLAAVRTGDERSGKWGYIDQKGRMIVNPQFEAARDFVAGLAAVRLEGKWGFIDVTGRMVVSPRFDFTWTAAEGLTPVRFGDDKTGKWGYMDRSGRLVIAPRFHSAFEFSEGLAAVCLAGGWGYIDRSGNTVIELRAELTYRFSEGLAPVRVSGGKWGHIDRSGKFVIEPQFDFTWTFSEGLAPAHFGDHKTGKTGYIDSRGNMVIAPEFDGHTGFAEGLAAVRIGDEPLGKWGYIDRTGKMVITPQFAEARPFAQGLAAVRTGDQKTGRWGFVDSRGKWVFNPQFDAVWAFAEGMAAVRVGDEMTGQWGYIDLPPEYRQPSNAPRDDVGSIFKPTDLVHIIRRTVRNGVCCDEQITSEPLTRKAAQLRVEELARNPDHPQSCFLIVLAEEVDHLLDADTRYSQTG